MKNKIQKVVSIVMVSMLFSIGAMTVLTYFLDVNLSIFIGICLCLVGLLTAHRSVVSEMQFKKYSGPDVLGGFAIVALGITVTGQAMLGVLFGCFPIFAGILGLWFLLDALLAFVVQKRKEWITLILGIIFVSLSIWLISSLNFGVINVLLCGISIIAYSIFILYKEFFSKDIEIKVEKVQEDYE